ncbi:hypothetical protein [Parahalioglobus pacificus]|uniref:Uncharacterized protein n=1 Tax=Parahalioglobus pacificus TaxID=930806 RepID=A0A918XI16_9GAMM|nr:hypothetical protein [Halioglobus pacificus]GHD31616.1 hypothetical protein GCM10007053_14850 [Halioglobus pacificus]
MTTLVNLLVQKRRLTGIVYQVQLELCPERRGAFTETRLAQDALQLREILRQLLLKTRVIGGAKIRLCKLDTHNPEYASQLPAAH